jgi:glycosyltransferase involved in cell wall biosynthesis
MKALFLSDDATMFDEASATRARMRAYASAIGELHILSRGTRDADDGPLHLHALRGGRIRALLSAPLCAKRIIREKGIEVVSAQDPFERGLAALMATRGTGAKLHVQVHTDFLSPHFPRESALNRARVLIASFVLPNADAVRAVSGRVARSLSARYGIHAAVLPITVEAGDAPPSALPRSWPFTLITAARLEKEKRVGDIIAALVTSGAAEAGLLVVGDGSERPKLERLAKRLKAEDRVAFLGWRTDLPGLLKSAHAYIQASSYEGYGRSLIEAAAAGLPLIATDAGLAGEAFLDRRSMLMAKVGDVPALAGHIRTLAGDPALRERLAKAAREAAAAYVGRFEDQPAMIRDDLSRALSS